MTEQWSDWSCCVFVGVKNPPSPPPLPPFLPWLSCALAQTYTSCCMCRRPAPPTVSQLTVKFWFSRAGGSRHPSSPSDARQDSKKRQTRPPHKQLEDSGAACRHGHPHLALRRKAPLRPPSSAVFSTAVAAPILCRVALFHFTATAHRSSVCRALAQVWGPRVLLSLAQRG